MCALGLSINLYIMLFLNSTEIIKLIQTGKMSQAIENTVRAYPGLLENNKNLLFALKCRQFIEMINGADIEVSLLYRML